MTAETTTQLSYGDSVNLRTARRALTLLRGELEREIGEIDRTLDAFERFVRTDENGYASQLVDVERAWLAEWLGDQYAALTFNLASNATSQLSSVNLALIHFASAKGPQ